MATYKHLRSSTANKRPTTSIADGQLAINTNTASPGLFFKDSAGTGIVKVGPVHVGTTAPNSVPASGGSTGNYKGEQWLDTSVSPAQLKVWNGSAWVGVVADELPVSKLQDGSAGQIVQTDSAGTGVEWSSTANLPLGSAGAPAYRFQGDANTGVYSPGADQVAISTAGTGRLFVDSSGRLLAGTSSARNISGIDHLTQIEHVTGGSLSLVRNAPAAASGPIFSFAKSRGSAVGDVTSVANGDVLGRIYFAGANGTDLSNQAAEIKCEVDTVPGVGDMPGRLVFSTTSDGASSPTERLRITSAGLVGIGTSSPSNLLHLAANNSGTGTNWSNANNLIRLEDTDDVQSNNQVIGGIVFKGNDTSTGAAGIQAAITANAGVGSIGGGEIRMYTSATSTNLDGTEDPRVIVTSAGNVGIGTSPDTRLNVVQSSTGRAWSATVGNGDLILERNGNAGLAIVAANTSASSLNFGDTDDENAGFIAYYHDVDALAFRTGGAGEDMRIDSSGRLLQGTSSVIDVPDYNGTNRSPWRQQAGTTYATTLQTNSFFSASATIDGAGIYQFTRSNTNTIGAHASVLNNSDLGFLQWSGSDGTNYIRAAQIYAEVDGTPGANDMPGRLVFSVTADGASSPTERMRITNDGQIWTGNSASLGAAKIQSGSDAVTAAYLAHTTSTASRTHFRFINPNGEVGSIVTSASATAYNTSSDYRLKENVTPVTDGITRLQQLKPSRFNFIADPDKTVDGFLAHEVQTIVPEAITGEKDAVDDEGNPEYQGIDQSKLVPLLTAALQEAIGEIESLKARVAALESA